MVRELNSDQVICVDQAKSFNWKKHTIGDKVHPNAAGAEKMAEAWFEAIKKILPSPGSFNSPEIVCYKKTDSTALNLHIFPPSGVKKGDSRPAIIYFFGGGWTSGTPLQFYRECRYWASKGMVAIAAEYRIGFLHNSTPFESYDDARDAIRWLRENSRKWHIDPDRIAAAGASAGGHLAAATGILKEQNGGRDQVSAKPNLMLLYYPVIDNSETGYGPDLMKKRYREISPLHNIDAESPPALFIVGTEDPVVPVNTAKDFCDRMKQSGVYCELHLFEGAGHPIFYYRKDLTPKYDQIRKLSEDFLKKFEWLHD